MPIYMRNKYTPPEFKHFQKRGRGFLWLAQGSVGLAEGDFRHTIHDLDERWEPKRGNVPRAYYLYANWTEADDYLRRLACMSEEERQKHLKLDKRFKLDEIMDRHAKVTAMIKQLEKERPEKLGKLLDDQLQYALERWLEHLTDAKKWGGLEYETESPDPMTNVEDMAAQRDHLEYAKIGIREARLNGRLKRLRFFDEFAERLDASDELFRHVLGGKRGGRISTDPTFGWHRHEPIKNDPSVMQTPWDED